MHLQIFKKLSLFGINDIPKFLLGFFIVLPVISILHELGHVMFAWLMGGKNIKVSIGSGKPILKLGMLEIRKYYFWYGLCTFDNLRKRERLSNILIFSGGVLFNILGIAVVSMLVNSNVLEANLFTYQFTYFSWYYVIFALLPMPYPDGNYSDGKIIYDLIKNRKNIIQERTYRVVWMRDKEQWHVLNHNNSLIRNFDEKEEALELARQIAEGNRPSKVLNRIEDGNEKEMFNFPRTPL